MTLCIELDKMYEQARRRYASRIPPGFADHKEKGEPDGFGDYIGWVQLMEFAKESRKPAILITDDAKEDWWQIQGDRTVGPRPELIAEFRSECAEAFYMYSSDQFMKFANLYLNERVPNDAISEVKESLEERLRSRSDKKPFAPASIPSVSNEKPLVALPFGEAKNLKPSVPSVDMKKPAQPEKPDQ